MTVPLPREAKPLSETAQQGHKARFEQSPQVAPVGFMKGWEPGRALGRGESGLWCEGRQATAVLGPALSMYSEQHLGQTDWVGSSGLQGADQRRLSTQTPPSPASSLSRGCQLLLGSSPAWLAHPASRSAAPGWCQLAPLAGPSAGGPLPPLGVSSAPPPRLPLCPRC